MSDTAKSRIQMLGVWCAPGYVLLLVVGWGLVAGFLLPPTHPTAGAHKIAELYASDYTRIRIGMLFVMVGALVLVPFAAVVAPFIARVERGPGVLTYTFLIGAAGTMCLTMYPALWWLVAAFRPDRSAALTQLINDAAWLQFLGGVTIYLAMPLAIAVSALLDQSATPTFPRWLGYANIWLVVALVPDQLLFFFKTGPFAWNGLFGIWLPLACFAGFFLANFFPVRKAILRERRADAPAEADLELARDRRL